MKEAYKGEKYKVLDFILKKGEKMPLHRATSDAFIINRKGMGKLTFSDREVVLNQGDHYLIRANEPHQLEILEDFEASVVFEPQAVIDFIKN